MSETEVVKVLSNISNIVLAVATIVLVVITGFYAWVTHRIFVQNRKMVDIMRTSIELQTRPYIYVYSFLVPGQWLIYLKIENAGKAAAKNMRLSLDRDFYQFNEKEGHRNLRSYRAFSEVIDSFPPGASLAFYLSMPHKLFSKDADLDKTPLSFCVTASYDSNDTSYVEDNIIDLNCYLNSVNPSNPIVSELEKITSGLGKVKEALDKVTRSIKSCDSTIPSTSTPPPPGP